MIESLLAHRRIRIAERTVFIDLILKQVGIDRARTDTVAAGERGNVRDTAQTIFKIPKNVERDGWTDAGERVDLSSIAKFLFDGGGGGRLEKLAEACAGVGESPGRNFDAKTLERIVPGT